MGNARSRRFRRRRGLSRITKAVIPAAGLGTRFLPATKAQPKEMLPVVDKPTIQYIVEEALEAGIEDILIITGRGKSMIMDHFDKSFELETTLVQRGKEDLYREVDKISRLANIFTIRQKEPLGLGHAVLCAKNFVGADPFALMLGDNFVLGERPCLAQLAEIFAETEQTVIGLMEVTESEVSRYGIVRTQGEAASGKVVIESLVEKPAPAEAPSRLAIMGRYILTPEIFSILEGLPPGRGGEIQLTDGISRLRQIQPVYGCVIEGENFDVGDRMGFIRTNVEIALRRQDMRREMLEYLSSLRERLEDAEA
ncbi:MAG: UTP--glucose-1-phosphate uridylyltransferase GalU [Gracilibacteraceae bacterium]|nr:UTP--glucose-1-phosphate uridylyltransferase GalU [Gracilibacteraceae bacterium]